MTFRPLTPSDWPAGDQILTDVFIGEQYVPSRLADKLSVETNARSGTWIGSFEGQGQLVGLVLLTTFGTDAARVAQPGGAEIRLLAVVPARRRSSVASGLVKTAECLASQEGRTTLSLSTQETMVAARHLYRRLGYLELPDRSYLSLGVRYLVLSKTLATDVMRDPR